MAASSAPPSTVVHQGQKPLREMIRVSSCSASSGRSPLSTTRCVSALRSSSCRRSLLSSDPVTIIIVRGWAPGGAYWTWMVREVTSTVMWSISHRAVIATIADSMARVSAPARNSSRPCRRANRMQATAVGSSTSRGSGKLYPSNSVPYSRFSRVDSSSRSRANCSRRARRRPRNVPSPGGRPMCARSDGLESCGDAVASEDEESSEDTELFEGTEVAFLPGCRPLRRNGCVPVHSAPRAAGRRTGRDRASPPGAQRPRIPPTGPPDRAGEATGVRRFLPTGRRRPPGRGMMSV